MIRRVGAFPTTQRPTPDPNCDIYNARASPRLKDAQLPAESCALLYTELILTIRKMFHQCKLVHADLSEYNILYHESHLWIIDVSQSVEQDHPSAFDFLRNDIRNVEEFFGRLGVRCLGLRRCFEFVTKEKLDERSELEEMVLMKWLETEEVQPQPSEDENNANGDGPNPTLTSSAHEDSVFLQSYIPRSLSEVYDPERDVAALKRGEGDGLIYKDTIGLVVPSSEVRDDKRDERKELGKVKVRFEDQEAGGGDSDGSDSQEDGEDDEDDGEVDEGAETGGHEDRKPRGHRHEDREMKKVNIQKGEPSTIYLALFTFISRSGKKQSRPKPRRSGSIRCPKLRKNEV